MRVMSSPQAASHVHRLLDRHWMSTLAVEPAVWQDAEVVVAAHPEPTHHDHVYLIRRGESCIIVVPEDLVGATSVAVAQWPSAAVFDAGFVRSLFPGALLRLSGPFWLGYATTRTFARADPRGSRPIDGAAEHDAVAALRAGVSEEECVDAGFEVPERLEFGCFVGDDLLAAGTLTPFAGVLANAGVLVHPQHRRAGYGTAMVSALTEVALGDSDTVQFRTLLDNTAALSVARRVGFVQDALSLEAVIGAHPHPHQRASR